MVPINEALDRRTGSARYLHDQWRLPHTRRASRKQLAPLAYALFTPFATDVGTPDVVMTRQPNGDAVSLAEPRRFLNTG